MNTLLYLPPSPAECFSTTPTRPRTPHIRVGITYQMFPNLLAQRKQDHLSPVPWDAPLPSNPRSTFHEKGGRWFGGGDPGICRSTPDSCPLIIDEGTRWAADKMAPGARSRYCAAHVSGLA